MKTYTKTLLIAATMACGLLNATSVNAAVIVTDIGLTAPTLGTNTVGLVDTSTGGLNRIGWDIETFTQTFTVASAGTIGSIFLGYNGFDDGDTMTLTLTVNGSSVLAGIFLDGDNFSGNAATDGNGGPFYWMELDLSAENVAVTAGLNTIVLDPTATSGVSWPLAARISTSSNYAGGTLNGDANRDLFFAVEVIPEPSTALLGALGLLLLLRRRR